jgi:hypothetical protein
MTASKTATIETLTAEVRVLMVGSRQVTLSVHGQLDAAEYEDMEPFGRVRPRDAEYGYIYFIGRHRENGTLVRGRIPADQTRIQKENPRLWAAISDCNSRRGQLFEFVKRHRDGSAGAVRCHREDHSQCEMMIYEPGAENQWPIRQVAAVEAEIQRLADKGADLEVIGNQEIAEALALRDKAAALPLIVLAGLR